MGGTPHQHLTAHVTSTWERNMGTRSGGSSPGYTVPVAFHDKVSRSRVFAGHTELS